MRRITEKVSAIVLITVSFIFVLFTLLLTFRAFEVTLLNNHIVVTLIIAISIIFAASSMVLCVNLFSDRDSIKNLLLFSDHSSSTRTSMNVVRRIIKRNATSVQGVRIHKSIIMQEANGFRLRIAIGVQSDDVQLTVDKLRVILEDAFINILGVRFNSIDFKVARLLTNYKLDSETIKSKAAALKDEQITEQQANYKATKVAKPDDTVDGVILKEDEESLITDDKTKTQDENPNDKQVYNETDEQSDSQTNPEQTKNDNDSQSGLDEQNIEQQFHNRNQSPIEEQTNIDEQPVIEQQIIIESPDNKSKKRKKK